MEKEDFSPEQSLQLIENMISKTKNSVADSSAYFLLWGWVVFIACGLQYLLKVVIKYEQHYYAWFMIIIGITGSIYLGRKQDKEIKMKTYIDESIDYLWMSIGISFIVLAFVFSQIGWQYCFPFYMLLYGIGCFVTGRLIKFSPLVWGGSGAWVLAVFSGYLDYDTNILLTACAVLISYIIPGYLLRKKYKKNRN
ncbi:MAG: hypothetical protein ABJA78_16180 [Ferruginibacter sp.]